MADLTLYHNPKCSTSNHALGVVQDAGVDADVVLYLKTPPDRAEEVRKAFAGSEHAIVQNGGHELLPVREVQDLVLAFLDGRPERPPIALPAPEVRTIEEARKAPPPRAQRRMPRVSRLFGLMGAAAACTASSKSAE